MKLFGRDDEIIPNDYRREINIKFSKCKLALVRIGLKQINDHQEYI